MKKALLISTLAVLATLSSYGQGTVVFANNSATRVTDKDGAFVVVGSRFNAELMFAQDGLAEAEFDASAIRLGAAINFGPTAGTYAGGGRTAPTAQPGGFGLFQVRVWETAAGVDYRTAVLGGDPAFQVGKSVIMRVDTGDPTSTPAGVATALTASGLNAFQLSPIPEPSVIGLGLLGAGALLMLRRRK